MVTQFLKYSRRAGAIFTLSVFLVTTSSCGTLISLTSSRYAGGEKIDRPLVYSGIRWDIANIDVRPVFIPLFILDLPLSFVMDTILLPVTISWAIGESKSDEEERKAKEREATSEITWSQKSEIEEILE